jgi:perosamine synthetase
MISLNTPNFIGNELKYLKDCIESGWVSTSGKYIKKFENKIAQFTKSKYAIALINATSAIDISLKLLGVKPNDEIIIPTLTFISPVNAILYNKASPIFMDCDDFCNIDVKKTIKFIKEETLFKKGNCYNKKTKKRISTLIIVHVWGNAVLLDDLVSVCKQNNIKILEDASESLGTIYKKGKFKGKHTGTIGDIGCISFNANKIITSGGGGMILTKQKKIAEKTLYITTQSKDDPIKYIHDSIGYNLRLTNVHAAIGLAQLEKINKVINKKKIINNFYKKRIGMIDNFEILESPKYADNNYWFNILKIKSFKNKENIDSIVSKLNQLKIQVRPIWHLNHKQKFLKKFQTYNIKKALNIQKTCLCLPSSSHLSIIQLKQIEKILKTI